MERAVKAVQHHILYNVCLL